MAQMEARGARAVFDTRKWLAETISVGWLDYLDETRPGWRSETPFDFSCPMPDRALVLAAERVLDSYDMNEVEA